MRGAFWASHEALACERWGLLTTIPAKADHCVGADGGLLLTRSRHKKMNVPLFLFLRRTATEMDVSR
jgi:hypothetical protein